MIIEFDLEINPARHARATHESVRAEVMDSDIEEYTMSEPDERNPYMRRVRIVVPDTREAHAKIARTFTPGVDWLTCLDIMREVHGGTVTE